MDDLQEHLEILDALYGEGVWEVSKSLTESQKNKRDQRVAQGLAVGNAVSAVAGPAALYSATRNARKNTGGWPRDVATGVGEKMSASSHPGVKRMGEKILKPVKSLNSPGSKKWKLAAIGAGATGIGLQAVNAGVDAASAKVLSNTAKEKKQKVAKSENVDIAIRGEVSKMDTEQKQVFGWASVIEVGGEPVIDLQDDVMTIETIEKAAYNYVHGSRKGGRQHERQGEEPLHVSDMIESFVLTPEKKEKMGIPDEVPTGWWVGFQIRDEDTWQQYKDGKLKDFSIHGSGRRVEVDA